MDLINFSLEEIISINGDEDTNVPRPNRKGTFKSRDEDVREGGIQRTTTDARVTARNANDVNKSLDDIIRERAIQRTAIDANVTAPNPSDVYKSLDEIVRERGIQRPATDASIAAPNADDVHKSLDEIVRERGIQIAPCSSRSPGSEINQKEEAKDLGKPEIQNSSPVTAYRAVSFLSTNGMIVEIVIGRLSNDEGNRAHLWRCIVKCGAIEGIADSVRKVVAREMASDNFLTRLKATYQNVKIPRYSVVDEIFIDPRLFHLIEKEATKKALDVSHEVRVKPPAPGNSRGNSYYTYVCTYYVGKNKCKGEHFIVEFAKLRAVREAFKLVTGNFPEPTKYFIGDECDRELEYKFSETEVYQTVEVVGREEFVIGNHPDAEQERIAVARREVAENFKRAKKEEENQRRNMPVSVEAFSDNRNTRS